MYSSCGFVVFQLCVRAREEGEPPPLWNRMAFPFAIHTHNVFVNVWPFYLPTPLLWNRMVFPFALRRMHTPHTHTHIPRVCVCMAFSLRTCSSAKPPFHSLLCGPSGVRDGVRHACRGGPPGLVGGGGGGGREGGGEGGGGEAGAKNAQRTTIYIYIYVTGHTSVYVRKDSCMYAYVPSQAMDRHR